MIDKFDYLEPNCPLCNGKDFYYPKKNAPLGRIPVGRIIEKVDACFAKNDYVEAGKLLVYWRDEALSLCDKDGELSMQSELIGYYRKQNDKQNALISVARALELITELEQDEKASGATIFINCATAYKAFDMPKEALPLYVRAENIYLNVLDKNDARFGGLYNNMALALVDLGDFDWAEKTYFKALAVMKNIYGGQSHSAITYVNLAHMYEQTGKTQKINECLNKAYDLLKSDALKHDGYYAFVLQKCAPSFNYFGRQDVYEQFTKEAKSIYERA